MIEYILNPQSVEALGWTLLHSIWQGAVFAIVLVLILIALRSYTAQSRYIVSVGILCAFFLTVSVTFWQHWEDANSRNEMSAVQLNSGEIASTFNNNTAIVFQSNNKTQSTPPLENEISAQTQSSWIVAFRDYYDRHLPLLVTLWFMGVLFLQLRFLGQLAYVQRLKHYGTQLFPAAWTDRIEELENKLRIQKKVAYLTSIRVESPMVIGWLKPVVLLPQQLFNSLSETEIYAVLAHELAHIRREDFMVNLMQTFLCNVFFFHPGVWWMSNRIDDEREHCCDDLAVAATGPATSYAKTLINVSELQLRMQQNPAMAMAFSGKNKKRERGGFSGRIRRLFMGSNGAGTFREGFATACILITALVLGLVVTGRTAQATDSQSQTAIDKTKVVSNDNSNPNSNEEMPNGIEIETETETETKASTESSLNESRRETTVTIKITDDTDADENDQNSTTSEKDLSQLPVAEPEDPENPEEPIDPVDPVDPINTAATRIDALVMACEEGDLDFVKTLVKSGIDVNGIGSGCFTALMAAVNEDEVEIVEYLIEQGADVDLVYNGWTALIEAADEGSLASMKLLLKAGAKIDYYSIQDSPTAISMAASEGKLNCLQLLLANGANINGIGKSLPPLHNAAAENKGSIIDYLISQKVNINKKDVNGHTALMHAASEGNMNSVVKLIEAGADISIIDLFGATAKDYAEWEEEYEIRDLLEALRTNSENRGTHSDTFEDRSSHLPAIHQATLDGLIEKAQRMVENGTDVNSRDNYGRTPLHISSAENHNIDMSVLVELGADINAQDNQGRTPLMYAALDAKKDAIAFLVSQGANVQIKDVDGNRAYELSLSRGNSDLTKFIGLVTENQLWMDHNENGKSHYDNSQETGLEKKIQNIVEDIVQNGVQKYIDKATQKVILKDEAKRETLHNTADGFHLKQYNLTEDMPDLLEAARNGSVEDCQRLLNNGHSVNSKDETGQTAIMVAAMTNRIDIAKFLIQQDADINKSSVSGLTALHYAALENHDQMAQLLLDNNAKIDAKMHYSSTDGNHGNQPLVWEYIGATPLLIAVESQNIEVLAVLIDAGANTNYNLTRNEYILNKDRVSYLDRSEVTGMDKDFLDNSKIQSSDDKWTPYKHALLLNEAAILKYFQK